MFWHYYMFTGTVMNVSALHRVYWCSYRCLGVTPHLLDVLALLRVHWYSYQRFGLTPRLLVQLQMFGRYAAFTGRFGATTCSLVQLSTFGRYAVPACKVIGVPKVRSAFTFGSSSPGRVSADTHLHQRRPQNLTHLRRSPRRTFLQNCVNVTCRAGPECRRFLTCVLTIFYDSQRYLASYPNNVQTSLPLRLFSFIRSLYCQACLNISFYWWQEGQGLRCVSWRTFAVPVPSVHMWT
jgi:hypothetical protein